MIATAWRRLRSAGPRARAHAGAVIALAVVAALTWVFVRADSISAREHQEYVRKIRLLRDVDARINLAVLSSRFGLQRHFDDLVAQVRDADNLVATLGAPPDFIDGTRRAFVLARLASYQGTLVDKADLVDQFKRASATLRNSLDYFPQATDTYLAQANEPAAVSTEIAAFSRALLVQALNDDKALGYRLEAQLAALRTRDRALAANPAREAVLTHGSLILEGKTALDVLTRRIMELPSAERAEAFSQAYSSAYEQASERARVYRFLLYAAAVLLGAYLVLAIRHLSRASDQLESANRELEEKVEALHQSERQLRLYATVFTNASEGMTITDAQSRVIAVNPAFTHITGYTSEQIIGCTPGLLRSGRHDAAFYRALWASLDRHGQWRGEIWNRRANGEIYPQWISITRVRNERDEVTHYIGLFSDITDRKEAEARIHHLAHHDPLTGLPNRTLLQDRLEQAIRLSRRNGSCTAVLFMDLDRFKVINDTLGHEVGDRLLTEVARRCQTQLRDADTLSRQGGDEFVVVLPEIDHGQYAVQIARKLLRAIEPVYKLGAHDVSTTASIGIALYPDDGDSGSVLLRNADTAMYRAKAEGRNCFQCYSADMNAASLDDLMLEARLRWALERDELVLHYQPRVCAQSGAIIGVEALLRWNDVQGGGLVMPERFIPIAEASGMIVPIGEWVLRRACRQLRVWIDAGREPVPIAVNLSAVQFARQDIPQLVRQAIDDFRLPPHLLELELTESMLMRDTAHAISVLSELRRMGVSLAIDDFGTGYSSLSYLRVFDVQTIKIDRSFVADVRPGGPDPRIVAAVIALGHSLGVQVVAEGVETEMQRDFLVRHDCDQLQGYLYGMPEDADRITVRLVDATARV